MKKKTTGHITIKDVAEFAGVSKYNRFSLYQREN